MSGRHGRRRFLGKGRGEKGKMSMGLMVGYLVGVVWGGVLMEGSFGEGVVW